MAVGFKVADAYIEIHTEDDTRKGRQKLDRDTSRWANQLGLKLGRIISAGMLAGIGRALFRALAQTAKLAAFGLVAGVVASAIGGLASAIANLIPLIAELVNALIAASGALLLIPGGIAAIITVVATLKLGMKGLGDAMKAVASGDAAQLNEALKKLAPNARAFVREIARIKPAFDRMRLRIQNALFAGLAKQMKELGKELLPVLNKGLVEMGRTLNGIVRDAFAFLLSTQTKLDLARIFHLASVAVGNLRRGLVPILSILRDIAVVGLEVLAQLTQGFGRTLTGWAADIAKLRQEGGLEELIRDGLVAAKALMLLLGDIVGIIRSLVRAAGGAGGLFSFFDRLNRLLQSVEGQSVLRELFEDLDRIGRALIPVLLALLKALMPVIEGIADIAEAFSPGLTVLLLALGNALSLLAGPISDLSPLLFSLARGLAPIAVILGELVRAATPGLTIFLDALVDALISLVPVAPIVGKALGDLFAALAPILVALGPTLGTLLTLLATGLSALARLLTPVIKLFADGFARALSELLPLMIEVAATLLPLLAVQGERIARAFAPLIPLFGQIVRMFFDRLAVHIPVVLRLLEQLIPLIGDWAEVVGAALTQALIDLMPMMPDLIRSLSELAIAALQLLVAVTPLLVQFARFVALILQLVEESGLLRFWLAVVTGLVAGLANALNIVAAVLRKVVEWLAGAKSGVTGFGRAITTSIGAAISLFTTLRSRILNAVGNLSRLLFGAGKNAIQGLIDGVRAAMPALANAVNKAAALVKSYWNYSPAKTGPLSGRGDLRFAGQNLVDRLGEGVLSRFAAARSWAAQLAGLFAVPPGGGLPAMAGGVPGPVPGAPRPTRGEAGPSTFGPYLLHLDDKVVAEFAINAMTGAPVQVAAAADEGNRRRTFISSARARR